MMAKCDPRHGKYMACCPCTAATSCPRMSTPRSRPSRPSADPVRGLVPHRLQVRHQLPAPHRRARRRPRQGAARRVHDLHHRHRGGVLRLDHKFDLMYRQARLRALVRRRGHGGGRVLRGSRGPRRPREGLRGGGRRVRRGRRRGGGRGVLSVLLTRFDSRTNVFSESSDGIKTARRPDARGGETPPRVWRAASFPSRQ